MKPPEPIFTAELFEPLHAELLSLLRGLEPADWDRRTVAGRWLVRDVVAHLLDGDLRKLSTTRDGHIPPPPEPIGSYGELVAFLNGLNADWVGAARRLSPRVLTDLIAHTGPLVADLASTLDPFAPSTFPVDWAGERQSANWFDVGREFTERWHHQMQIRDAVGVPLLLDSVWSRPLFDLSLRALPHAYRDAGATEGTAVTFRIREPAVGDWTIVRDGEAWRLYEGAHDTPSSSATVDADTGWRILYNAVPPERARERVAVQGDRSLIEPFFRMRTIMI